MSFIPSEYEPIVVDIETTTDHKTIRLVGYETSLHRWTGDMWGLDSILKDFHKKPVVLTWYGSRFDKRILEEHGMECPEGTKFVDLMLLAKMVDHTAPSFSLEAWAKRYGVGDKSDFSDIDYDECPLEDLKKYLKNDLCITWAVYKKLVKEPIMQGREDKIWQAMQLEHEVAEEVEAQVQRRVRFDIAKACKLEKKMLIDMAMLGSAIKPNLPKWKLPKSKIHQPPKHQFNKDGSPSKHLLNYLDKYNYVIVPPKSAVCKDDTTKMVNLPLTEPLVTEEQIELGNHAAMKDWLLSEGWEPTEWNTKFLKDANAYVRTSPRLTLKDSKEPCPNLTKLGHDWVGDYSDWLTVRSRKNVLHSDKGTGWIPKAEKDFATGDYTLPSDADTMGANTGRFTHRVIANVPRTTSPYGQEMRELFCARDGKVWVGWDASALEARVEAHYCYKYDALYSKELCEGDVHQRNLDALPELGDRDAAKKFKYSITYGAQPAKLGKTFSWDKTKAMIIYEDFWRANEALAHLKDDVVFDWLRNDKKFITGLDGRPIHTRSKHSLLNALFQSAGAIIMKYAMIIAKRKIKELYGDRAVGLIRYHDEEVWECDPEIAGHVKRIGEESIRAAGRYLKLNVPLDAEGKIGMNWAEIH